MMRESWLVSVAYLVWLVPFNQTDQTNQMNWLNACVHLCR